MKPNYWIPPTVLLTVFLLRWQCLQLVAWISMLVRYSWQHGPVDGWRMTFDGIHPCAICHAVASGSSAEAALLGTLAAYPALFLVPTAVILIGFTLFRQPCPVL